MFASKAFILASRPNFPRDLQVLLLETDLVSRKAAETLLQQCQYQITSCSSATEALTQLGSPKRSFDVLLAEAKAVDAAKSAEAAKLLQYAKKVPLVLMGDNPSPAEVLQGMKLGAVDYLERPLATGKLRCLWQYTVRKMMGDAASTLAMRAAHGLAANLSETPDSNKTDNTAVHIASCCDGFSSGYTSPHHAGHEAQNETESSSESQTIPLSRGQQQQAAGARPQLQQPGGPATAAAARATSASSAAPQQQGCTSKARPAAPQPTGLSRTSSAGVHPANKAMVALAAGGNITAMHAAAASLNALLPFPAPPLPSGMAWGLPMNPLAAAPGIAPPAVPPPVTPVTPLPWAILPLNVLPAAMGAMLPAAAGAAAAAAMAAGMVPMMAMPGAPAASAPMMGLAGGWPAMMPSAALAAIAGASARGSAAGQAAAAPLSAAAAAAAGPTSWIPADIANQSFTSLFEDDEQPAVWGQAVGGQAGGGGSHGGANGGSQGTNACGMHASASHKLLPSLEELMGGEAEMDFGLDVQLLPAGSGSVGCHAAACDSLSLPVSLLGLQLKKSNSFTDLVNQQLMAGGGSGGSGSGMAVAVEEQMVVC